MAEQMKKPTTAKKLRTSPAVVGGIVGQPSEEIVWTALPNGIKKVSGQKNRLKISVFVAPRLRIANSITEPHLASFDDFLDWPARVKGLQFAVEFEGGPKVQAQKVSADPDSSLWKAIFKGDTNVESFTLPDYQNRPILDYPVANVRDFLKSKYLTVASQPETAHTMPTMGQLAHEDILGRIAFAPHSTYVAAREIAGIAPANKAFELRTKITSDLMSLKAFPRTPIANPEHDFARLALFHEPVAVKVMPLIMPELDFHTALSSLGKYPDLMRMLGLVVDLEIDSASIPASSTVRVLPDWGSAKSPAVSRCPRTAYLLSNDTFIAAPNPSGSDIQNGMLKLHSDNFEVITLDVDGAASKAMEFANQAAAVTLDVLPNAKTNEPAGLPALRTGGISVVQDGRAEKTHKMVSVAHQNYVSVGGGADAVLHADDVMRGIRVDVWDSTSGNWNSLCRRKGIYKFLDTGKELEIDDEGFVSSAVTKAPEGTSDDPTMRQHQSLFSWNGWSLCAARPGKTITLQDKAGDVDNSPTSFKLKTSFTAAKGSLPKLRYGNTYRIRARVVDLAGNSLNYDEPDPKDFSLATAPTVYARFEPIASPTVVPRVDFKGGQPGKTVRRPGAATALPLHTVDWGSPGESVERLVIRSFNANPDVDHVVTTQTTDRHVAPPKTAQISAEFHGMFDDRTGLAKGSYSVITAKDSSLHDIEPAESLVLPYLPDPLALGTAFSGLPGTTGETTVDFYPQTKWPDARPFRLKLCEGTGKPAWDAGSRVLTVFLPKSEVVTLKISSMLTEPELGRMAMWNWLEQASSNTGPAAAPLAAPVNKGSSKPKIRLPKMNFATEGRGPAKVATPTTTAKAVTTSSHTAISMLSPTGGIEHVHVRPDVLANLKNIAVNGQHWMMTPFRTITLVHAVQQPLTQPVLKLESLRNLNDTGVGLDGEIRMHPKSTSKVNVIAEWTEQVDPLSEKKPKTISGHAHVFEKMVEPDQPMVRFGGNRQEFHDTKYRKVRYSPIAATRFREYFSPSITDDPKNITRPGATVEQDILNSARPTTPKVLYVIPTFGWQDPQQSGDTITHKRTGGGLRVYLDRPWFSSGDGELLGVVLVPQGGASHAQPAPPSNEFKSYVTQWGDDPIWEAHDLFTSVPLGEQFSKAVTIGKNLSIPEVASTEFPNGPKVAVAGHKVEYDEARQLWYCDIVINPEPAYYPFIRLALARYQPNSLTNAHLSRVVLADFAQLAPDRTLIVIKQAGLKSVKVAVTGSEAYQGSWLGHQTSEVEASLEEQQPGVDELAWAPVANSTVTLVGKQVTALTTTWLGELPLPQGAPGKHRLIIKEYERYAVDNTADADAHPKANSPKGLQPATGRRLVYADALILQ